MKASRSSEIERALLYHFGPFGEYLKAVISIVRNSLGFSDDSDFCSATRMNATLQRDQAIKLAKTDALKALATANSVEDPWFRAQALSWVARFTDSAPEPIAAQAAEAAAACDDDYKKAAVRAWEIAALAERKCLAKAKNALQEALAIARRVQPSASRSEALLILMQAAFTIDRDTAANVSVQLTQCCPITDHWRCRRAARRASQMLEGKLEPRKFFW